MLKRTKAWTWLCQCWAQPYVDPPIVLAHLAGWNEPLRPPKQREMPQ